jgi:hypothetical protein
LHCFEKAKGPCNTTNEVTTNEVTTNEVTTNEVITKWQSSSGTLANNESGSERFEEHVYSYTQ